MSSIPYASLHEHGIEFIPLPVFPGVLSQKEALLAVERSDLDCFAGQTKVSLHFGQKSLPRARARDTEEDPLLDPLVWLVVCWKDAEWVRGLRDIRGECVVIDAHSGNRIARFTVRTDASVRTSLQRAGHLADHADEVVVRLEALHESFEQYQQSVEEVWRVAATASEKGLQRALDDE